ncbi:TonB-dependent receptor [Dethiosulfatarculus sandiegensis]|uniref:TonB-denpendent receptor n=1 Tax=Dethiosulfatarculus sandiegensis TaxID=1429043 RepID=A0A0D2JW85_9BACT|nr:TonB-dependent receptor [Dethiosulfatarculus sandiegensis]KIX13865.1 hypothetical protein X474_11455 [Dethiosulfatarculus sandiegensis]
MEKSQILKKALSFTGAALLIFVFSGAALAQAKESNAFQLSEINVTAQKRGENAQKVPTSLDAFSGYELEQADIRDFKELAPWSSNLYISAGGTQNMLVIRGVSTFSSSIYSPAGFYVDDIPFALQSMQEINFMDVERVEILKGPQGTLYGRNSESGLVHVITRKPDTQLKGRATLEYGSYNTTRLQAGVSGPVLKDKFYAGINLQTRQSDGYMENLAYDDEKAASKDHLDGRLNLRFTPSEAWDIQFISFASRSDEGYGIYRFSEGMFKTDPYKLNQDIKDQYYNREWYSQNLKANYEGSNFDLLLVGGYLDFNFDSLGDRWLMPSPNGTSFLGADSRQASLEMRISSKPENGPASWLAGVSAFSDKTDYDYNMKDQTNLLIYKQTTDLDTQAQGLFGQATYSIFQGFKATLGARLDIQKIDGEINNRLMQSRYQEELGFNEFLPKASLSYDLNDQAMLYVSASRGYLTGGFNHFADMIHQETAKTYDPEYTWNYEAGLKSQWFEKKLLVNLSVFYIDISDKQVSEVHPFYEVARIRNAAQAHSSGLELSVKGTPAKGLEVFANLGLSQAEIDDWKAWEKDGAGNLFQYDYSGKKLQYAPDYTYNLGAQYNHTSGLFGRMELNGVGQAYGDPKNQTEQDAYELVNIRLGYQTDHYDISLWAMNLFDTEYSVYTAPYGNMGTVVADGEPLTIGATLTWRF